MQTNTTRELHRYYIGMRYKLGMFLVYI